VISETPDFIDVQISRRPQVVDISQSDQGPEMHVHRPAPREISTDASIERTMVTTGIHDFDPHMIMFFRVVQ